MHRFAYISVLIVLLALPALAHASASDVIRDCADNGKLDHHYSNSDLKKAQSHLPSDLDEYSDCREVIGGAITGGSDKGGGRNNGSGGGAGGAGAAAVKAKKSEANARKHDKALLAGAANQKPKLGIGDKTVEPGSNGLFKLDSASNGLPLPLLLALIAVGLLAVLGALYGLRKRVPALARIPLPQIDLSRVPIPRLRR